ncbi:MAG TPA: hypothetical protein VFU89_02415 [Rhabdochlamydiaceae bacterium]|nr:hypothetical protein [Rhabdochlamydiaceae bacterium]
MKIKRWNTRNWFIVLVLFLLVFPKGGFKIEEIPITWGYLFLGITSLLFFLKSYLKLVPAHFSVILSLLPFQLYSIYMFMINGVANFGFAISFIIHFIFIPFLFFIQSSKLIADLNVRFFVNILKKSIFFISLFGIFIFSFRIFTGDFLLIPFLTSNLQDTSTFELTKNIARGNLFKLFSTYNNGNLLGICLLMLLPLYQHVEKKTFMRSIVKIALVLTLSRTVWIGLLLAEILRYLYIQKITIFSVLKLMFHLSIIGSILAVVLHYLDRDLSFILDPTLGGRSELFNIISDFTWIGNLPFEGICEIIYLGILKNFGLLGLISFIIAISSPLWIYVFSIRTQTTSFQRSLLSGLFIYLIISCSDGAILFIPVMVFYWFLSALLLAKPEFNLESFEIFEKEPEEIPKKHSHIHITQIFTAKT